MILVVGDLLVDVVAAPAGPLREGSDTPSRNRIGGGGSAANTAAWVASLGAPVALVAAIGDDDLGTAAATELARSGVHHLGPVLGGAATGTCVVLVAADGERTMLPDRGANEALAPETVVEAVERSRPAWVHLSGYTLLAPGSRPAGVAALAAARALGCPTSVDAASAGPIADVGAGRFLDLVGGTDVLFANSAEVDALGGEAAVLASVAALVHKRGPAGAVWTDGVGRLAVDAVPSSVVDTTGAGDAFAAGYLAATSSGAPPAEALHRAAAVAARAVSVTGGRPPS